MTPSDARRGNFFNPWWALKKDSRKTILLSAVMNTASFAAGLIVFVPRP
jgi:hypothetical protein